LGGMWLLHLSCKHGKAELTPDQQSFTITAMMIGVLLGGRLGYSIFYALEETLHRPWVIFQVWKGGMASHGGFIGVLVACWWVAKKLKLSFLKLGDLLCPLVPPGIMLGRIANFINGELWGKISNVSWAVIFPQSSMPGTPLEQIPARHPSQLYEAGLEGALLLIYIQWRFWKTNVLIWPGKLAGEFLIIYAVVRIFGEQFREPDASLIAGLSRGSFYSIFLFAGGLYLILRSRKIK
jgi:phosphatidylglycerol---prolipoprotein diacylglyceryl transferase